MVKISHDELKDITLITNEQMHEYQLELAKAKARFDAELYYKNSIELRNINIHKSFLYSLLSGVVGLCLGYWLSQLTK